MKRALATRLYTFRELMNRLDSYTFMPVHQPGEGLGDE